MLSKTNFFIAIFFLLYLSREQLLGDIPGLGLDMIRTSKTTLERNVLQMSSKWTQSEDDRHTKQTDSTRFPLLEK